MKTRKFKSLKKAAGALCALILTAATVLVLIFFAPTYAVKQPSDNVTRSQPFVKGMFGVKKFRIPAMITMPDGTIVASCDARWNTFLDGGGLDTIATYSDDDGKSWHGTFANYLGDNGNRFDTRSSTFIDPALICTKDGVLYLAVTFYPADISLNSSPKKPVKAKAFDENGRLLICSGNSDIFEYTLGEFESDGFAKIFRGNENAYPEYKVDKYFNIYKNDKQSGNLFFKNAPFGVMPTTYIYLNASYDNGKTWEEPRLLNVKNDNEEFYGIAPGRGLELDNGTIVFSAYSLTGFESSSQKSSFIYSSDGGKSWERAPSVEYNGWSGESQLVKLSENTLRCFFRNGNSKICYCDATFTGNAFEWSEIVVTDIENNSNCMISAINCSKTIDSKRVIAVSCPTNKEKRAAGKIFIFTLDGDNNMTLYNTVKINDGAFGYSCLTETADGKLALLYEVESHQIVFESGIDFE